MRRTRKTPFLHEEEKGFESPYTADKTALQTYMTGYFMTGTGLLDALSHLYSNDMIGTK
ncbi:hypothetical protein HMPREF1207_04523 [Paenibacillus sp. HGH0039]|nr:hypothetical protein HMPREF1207_04523 [Paenibacillus sp. HGH0039]